MIPDKGAGTLVVKDGPSTERLELWFRQVARVERPGAPCVCRNANLIDLHGEGLLSLERYLGTAMV